MAPTQEKLDWRGQDMVDAEGGKIGRIEEIYLDADTDEPEWALVHTGMFGTKQTFVPIRDASSAGDGVSVPFDAATVKSAPKAEADGQLSQEEESALYSHYGMNYSEANSDSGLPEGGAPREVRKERIDVEGGTEQR